MSLRSVRRLLQESTGDLQLSKAGVKLLSNHIESRIKKLGEQLRAEFNDNAELLRFHKIRSAPKRVTKDIFEKVINDDKA